MNRILMFFYNVLVFIVSLVIFPIFKLRKKTKEKLYERYAVWKNSDKDLKNEEVIWFHGASMGEVKGMLPVIKEIKKRTGKKIFLTTTSVAGLEAGKGVVDFSHLIPFDTSFYYKKILKKIHPSKIIITETEIWPELIYFLKKRNVPLYLINGRISDNTIKTYQKLSFFITPLLNNFTKILAQTKKDVENFNSLKIKVGLCEYGGNSKYEMVLKIKDENEAKNLSSKFFPNENIKKYITFSCIRPKEEEMFFPTIKVLLEKYNDIGIIIAPRHKEKFLYFEEKLNEEKISFIKWSRAKEKDFHDFNVVLLDTFGELENVFSFSNLAFIGATVIDKIGGHNPMEAMKYGAYVFVGEHYYNYADVINELVETNSVSIIKTKDDFADLISVFLTCPELLEEKGKRGKALSQKLSGATKNIVDAVLDNLDEK